jgi:uncharacterized protein (DUF2235 family)
VSAWRSYLQKKSVDGAFFRGTFCATARLTKSILREEGMKNIVICCDGTGNEYGEQNSNVEKLYSALDSSLGPQVSYYHPGVGTMGAKSALTWIGKVWTKFEGLAFGYGLSENIADAYRYLMLTYEPGDKIFIFGFSRGAYTARALCGMLEMFGLLSPGNEGMIPYAIRLFKMSDGWFAWLPGRRKKPTKFALAAGFKRTFCRDCKPHFVGVWDTVSSVGWILDPIGLKPGTLPYTKELGDVSIIRHAVSLDERRAFFRQNLILETLNGQPRPNLKQVWFAGVHSDVGGSYPEAESGLSKISLSWMFREASQAGLLLDMKRVGDLLGGYPKYAKPLANAMMHNSLKGFWVIGEFYPKSTEKRVSPTGVVPAEYKRGIRVNLFRRRFVPEGSCIHESVFLRSKLVPTYQPSNLPKTYTVEPDAQTVPYPVTLNVNETAVIGVFSELKWNDTGLFVHKGEQYQLEASGTWFDASIRTGPDGYASPSFLFKLLEALRRCKGNNWFALVGVMGRNGASPFLIGTAPKPLEVPTDGILHCYANDLPFLYSNNSGYVILTVKRLVGEQASSGGVPVAGD